MFPKARIRRNASRLLSRLGKAQATMVVATAAAAGATGLVYQQSQQTASVQNATQLTSAPADLPVYQSPMIESTSSPQLTTEPHGGSWPSPTSAAPGHDYSQSGGAYQPPPVMPSSNFAARSAPESPMMSDPPAAAAAEQSSAIPNAAAASQPRTVQVFYATDRASAAADTLAFWLPIWGPVVLFGFLAMMCLAVLRAGGKLFWGMGLIGCLAAGSFFALRATQLTKSSQTMVERGNIFFSGDRNTGDPNGPMQYGQATVTLPTVHTPGLIERPNYMLLEFEEDPDEHVTIASIEKLDEDDFFSGVNNQVALSVDPAVLVFVHGYNVAFADALMRTAQLSADLSFRGVPLLYSWPSAGRLTGYTYDEASVEWSVTHFEEFLLNVRSRTSARKVHLIVHSMGNRLLLEAAERLSLRFPQQQPMLGQVVMAAPDVDLENFRNRYHDAITRAAEQVTLYASSGDRALQASMAVHGYDRLGLSRPGMRTFMHVDTVDVTGLDTSLLGHSYYGDQENLIKDIRALIEMGDPPLRRVWLKAVDGSVEPVLWRFAQQQNPAATR